MAASRTLPQPVLSRKSPINKSGVLTIDGYGMRVRMQSGHLEIEDGIGPERRRIRLARVGHGLKRLVVVGSDGFVTLEALRWLADQDASFVMLERDGNVLVRTGPVRPSEAKLRRAQALAHSSGAALRISRELISRKLDGQEAVARNKLLDTFTADTIARFKAELPSADCISTIRLIESQAARAYWSAWSTLPIIFPKNDQPRIPEHWRSFGTRVSPLTGSPRLAVNPPNAILNYLYAVLESEAGLAASALGLDPGLGVLHVDTSARDSLACDLMEPVRPQVDSYLLDWITTQPLTKEWFAEQRDGNCRLLGSFAAKLSETTSMWGRAVAPVAEWVAHTIWSSSPRKSYDSPPATRLTQRLKREAKGAQPLARPIKAPRRENLCPECGVSIQSASAKCASCAVNDASKNLEEVARIGRQTANGPEAQLKRAMTQRRNALAQHAWKASNQPAWLNEKFYADKIQPLLSQLSASVIARQIAVSRWYAGRIREGYRPHPRHWQALANLVGVFQGSQPTMVSNVPPSPSESFVRWGPRQ